MAYDYNKYKKTYLGLDDNQKQQWDNKYGNTADYKQFQTDYQNELRNNTVSTPTNTYGDTGGAANATKYTGTGVSGSGDYKYNSSLNTSKIPSNALLFGNNAVQYESQNKGYLENRNNTIANALYNEGKTDEDSVRNYLNNFNDYTTYDKVGQDNTVQAILNRMGSIADQRGTYTTNANSLNSTLSGVASDINNQGQKGYSDLMGGSNYPQDFDEAVRQKLSTAYGISDLNEFRSKYPEQYESLMQALESVRGARDATDPTQRQMLDGRLQGIIGTGVGAGSDTSKLNVLNQTLIDKFEDGNKVSEDMRNIVKLQTEGLTTSEIAKQMGISEDQVQQAILAYNGLDNKLGEYYKLKEGVAKDITEPYDIKMARNDEEKKIALERANRQVEWLTEDFNTTLERQKQQNDINAHNADAIAGRTGLGFSKRGIEGLNYVADQAKQIIDDITKNYDRNNQNLADGIADIIRNWQRNNDDLMKASQDALTNAKNNFTSNMLVVQQKYGTVGLQAQQYLAQNVQGFIEQAEAIYDNALTRQQQNLTNLITNVSNINALEAQNLTMRNAKIQQFQAESMNLNRNQLQSLADQLGMDTSSYQDLVNYQAQAVANQLNGYLPGSGVNFQDQIQSLLNQGYTPTQAMQSIMNSQEFKAMQQATNGTANKRAMSGGIMYNQATGEYMDLNDYSTKDERGSAGGGTIYNKSTGELKTIKGDTVNTTNPNTGAFQKVDLGYKNSSDMVDTGIASANEGQTLKFAPEIADMFMEAYNSLAAQGIELRVGDSYRTWETQQRSYESGKAGVVSPDKSYHVKGQAFDVVQDGSMYTDEVVQALLDAGFTRPNAKEPRHRSYGEGKDAFGGKPRNTDAYDMARAILDGVGTLPAKNSKEYQNTVNALFDLKKQLYGDGYPEGEALINYSVVFDSGLAQSTVDKISGTMQSIYSTDTLMKTLQDNEYKTGPIINKLAKLNPRDADYASIHASINQMASNIARGFGEKGVLTDADIERYMKTIPNEKMGNKARDVVGTLLKAKLYDGLIATIESEAKNKKDVSMYLGEYREAVKWLEDNGFRTKGSGGGRGIVGDKAIDTSKARTKK